MRSRWNLILGIAALAIAAVACGDQATTESDGAQTLRITSPRNGSNVEGNVVRLDMSVSGIEIVKADGDASGKTGHFHVFIDREPVAAGAVIDRSPGVVHSADDPIVLTGLTAGYHTFVVVLGDGAHRRVGNASARTQVEVKGPALDATAPATSPVGQPVSIDVKVQGVTLVAADGDISGKTGHLHVFVDREPTAAGQAIPKEAGVIHAATSPIKVEGLAAGEHTLWVVLGNGVHVPFAPLVADKLTVTVN